MTSITPRLSVEDEPCLAIVASCRINGVNIREILTEDERRRLIVALGGTLPAEASALLQALQPAVPKCSDKCGPHVPTWHVPTCDMAPAWLRAQAAPSSGSAPERPGDVDVPAYGNALCVCGHTSARHGLYRKDGHDACTRCGCEAFAVPRVIPAPSPSSGATAPQEAAPICPSCKCEMFCGVCYGCGCLTGEASQVTASGSQGVPGYDGMMPLPDAVASAAHVNVDDLPELMNAGRWHEATMLLIQKVDSLYKRIPPGEASAAAQDVCPRCKDAWAEYTAKCHECGWTWDVSRLGGPPCQRCGYNGPGYYQPTTHPCAASAGTAPQETGQEMKNDSTRVDTMGSQTDSRTASADTKGSEQ